MSIVLNGTTGITTPDIDSTAAPDFDGANITNIPAGNLTGALPAISGAALTGLPAVSLANATDVTVSTADPAENSNPASGLGHMWINKTSGEMYVLTTATAGANIWKLAAVAEANTQVVVGLISQEAAALVVCFNLPSILVCRLTLL